MAPLQSTYREIPPSAAIDAGARRDVDPLARIALRIVNCHAVLTADGLGPQRVHPSFEDHVDLLVRNPTIAIDHEPAPRHEHDDLYTALDRAFARASRRLSELPDRRELGGMHPPRQLARRPCAERSACAAPYPPSAQKTPPKPYRILVPFDFGPGSERARAWAAELQRAGNVESLVVVHFVKPVLAEALAAPIPVESPSEADLAAQRTALNAGNAIVALARRLGTTLIVMGTHGRGGLRRAALGSVADDVVRHADCAVVTLRATHAEAATAAA